jgi:hypothetical protein
VVEHHLGTLEMGSYQGEGHLGEEIRRRLVASLLILEAEMVAYLAHQVEMEVILQDLEGREAYHVHLGVGNLPHLLAVGSPLVDLLTRSVSNRINTKQSLQARSSA